MILLFVVLYYYVFLFLLYNITYIHITFDLYNLFKLQNNASMILLFAVALFYIIMFLFPLYNITCIHIIFDLYNLFKLKYFVLLLCVN